MVNNIIILIIMFNPMVLIRYILKFSFITHYHIESHSFVNKMLVC